MKRSIWGANLIGLGLILSLSLVSVPAQAALPELRLSPLKYTEHLELGHPKIGWLEADNPTGTTTHVDLEVQAFRQINNRGELEYYDDERIKSAITPALPAFDLGPREAMRIKFQIDPNRLGPGGAYGVIFLRVSSGDPAASQINTTARIGTLLILDVGGKGTMSGRITGLSTPGIVFGTHPTLPISMSYTNTGSGDSARAFTPKLTATVGLFDKPQAFTGPFVFPGRGRSADFKASLGNHFGPTRILVSDSTGHARPITRWIFLVTGIWTWLAPLLTLILLIAVATWYRRRVLLAVIMKRISPRPLTRINQLNIDSVAEAPQPVSISKRKAKASPAKKSPAKPKSKTTEKTKPVPKPRKRKSPKAEV